VAARKGQQTFRKRLVRSVGYCEVTASKLVFAMDACHIKPHAVCLDEEKNDQNNALLLLSSIHRAFDHGLISFQNDGRILMSSELDEWEYKCLGLTGKERIRMPGKRPLYMTYHRDNIYKP
jgi:predicted restriction endonuclease